jgi:AcrR family transcriptional regulator
MGSGERDKREAILDAALALFVERGFHGTAVPAIAERAGVAAGTIYRYFESKEALVNELYRHLKQSLTRCVSDDFPTRASPREQFHAYWSRTLHWALEHREAFSFLEFHSHGAYLDRRSVALHRDNLRAGMHFVERAQRHKALRPLPPGLLIGLVLGALSGVLRAGWEGGLALDEATLAEAEQCCWEAIRA